MEKSSLTIEIVPKTKFDFSFGKYEIYAGVPKSMKQANRILLENEITPFAKERCGAVEHVYFYGKLEKIRSACSELLKENPDVILCGRVERGVIGGMGCYPEELKREEL